jgi:hypothetical protein
VTRPCTKTRYRDRIAALNALSRIGRHDEERAKAPSRAYSCRYCHGWHLTSQERKTELEESG